jgi:hypothetical protein
MNKEYQKQYPGLDHNDIVNCIIAEKIFGFKWMIFAQDLEYDVKKYGDETYKRKRTYRRTICDPAEEWLKQPKYVEWQGQKGFDFLAIHTVPEFIPRFDNPKDRAIFNLIKTMLGLGYVLKTYHEYKLYRCEFIGSGTGGPIRDGLAKEKTLELAISHAVLNTLGVNYEDH